MAVNEDVVKVLGQTTQSLREQSEILRAEAVDLRKDSARIRAVSRKRRLAWQEVKGKQFTEDIKI